MTNKNKRISVRRTIGYVCVGFLFLFAIMLSKICEWSVVNFNVSLEEIIFTITSPLKGTEEGMVSDAFWFCFPTFLLTLFTYLGLIVIDCWNRMKVEVKIELKRLAIKFELVKVVRRMVAVCSLVALCFSFGYVNQEYEVVKYIQRQFETSTIYEEYYVDPNSVTITPKGEKKNLICVYVESMENTYASKVDGGQQEETYMPKLIELTEQGVSFSHTEGFGGFSSIPGTYWTMAALLATTSGVPFSFPVEANSMGKYEKFASGLTTLGDILEEQGYRQMFLCGSDAEFGGRKQYFQQHGNYEIFDLYTARENEYIAEDYFTWWGFEDKYLFDIAKEQLVELASGDEPFNFTMLTVDTHPVGGYVCEWCGDSYENETANVIACTDRQVYEFVEWCRGQEFYEDTAIVVIGDHLRMDASLMEDVDHSKRRVYNCFINSFLGVPDKAITKNRIFTTVDIFPTILGAMGYEFNGDRLGLGTNMFSGKQTLAEEMGYEIFTEELSRNSKYYIKNFR